MDVEGKGGKFRRVPATDELVAELRRYRHALGLTPLPSAGDPTPAVLPLIGPRTFMTRTAIYELFKDIVRTTADRVRARGPEHSAAAAHIERASPHWMRHTAASHQSGAINLTMVRDNMGHDKIATTSLYLHSEDDARHDATNSAHRAGWGKSSTERNGRRRTPQLNRAASSAPTRAC